MLQSAVVLAAMVAATAVHAEELKISMGQRLPRSIRTSKMRRPTTLCTPTASTGWCTVPRNLPQPRPWR